MKHFGYSKIHPPFAAKRRPTKRPRNLTDLGRISDETARLHMDQYVSRTLECLTRLPVSDLRFGVTVRDGLRQGYVSVIGLR
jgi:hypothetical protein